MITTRIMGEEERLVEERRRKRRGISPLGNAEWTVCLLQGSLKKGASGLKGCSQLGLVSEEGD